MEKIFKLIKSLFLMDVWTIFMSDTSLDNFFNSKGKILFFKKKKIQHIVLIIKNKILKIMELKVFIIKM